MTRLLVGLGNPGARYAKTRHNAGFIFLEAAARQLGAVIKPDAKFHGLVGSARWQARKLWFLMPDTFMNHSGQAVASLASYYGITAPEILTVHDDLDLPPGVARLKKGGGHGGHNGLRSLIANLGGNDFQRLRIGIGHPGDANRVVDYVLAEAPAAEQQAIDAAIAHALALLPYILDGDLQHVMRELHADPEPPRRE